MKIRRIEEGEIETVAKIIRKEIYPEISERWMIQWMKNWGEHPFSQYFVAEEKGKILGTACWSIWDIWSDNSIKI